MKKKVFLGIIAISMIMFSNVGTVLADTWNVIISNHKFLVNDEVVDANALNINGNNYFQVSEFAKLLDIDISFDKDTGTVSFDKSKPFSGVRTINKQVSTNNLTRQAMNIDADTEVQVYEYNGIIKANNTNVLHTASLEKDDIITVSLKFSGDNLLSPQVPIKKSKKSYSHILNFIDKNTKTYTVSEKDYYEICIYNPNTDKEVEYSITVTIGRGISNSSTDKDNIIKNQQTSNLTKTEVSFDKFNLKSEIWYGPYKFYKGNTIQSSFSWYGINNLQLAIIRDDPSSYDDNSSKVTLLKNNLQNVYEIVEDGEYYIILSADTESIPSPEYSYLENVNGYFDIK